MKITLSSLLTIPLMLAAITLTACATRTNRVDFYGEPAPASMAERTIVIGPDTKHVNVEGGQIVRFIVGDKEFTWNFTFAQTVGSLDLKEAAPPGMLDHTVRAYVSPDPRYTGDGGGRDR
jgi:hypothetical protein